MNSEVGEELGIIDNGTLSILKDINPGTNSSTPQAFISFNNHVYFTALGANGWGIWRTDGTEAGTIIFFEIPNASRPGGYIISKSGFLYFTYEDTLYQTDGIEVIAITSNIDFESIDGGYSRNYATYKNGIAFFRNLESEDRTQLLTVSENGLDTLAELAGTSRWIELYGLGELKDGLLFLVSDSFNENLDGSYVYKEETTTITKIAIDGYDARIPRVIDYNADTKILMVPNKGFYAMNAVSSPAQLIFDIEPDILAQGNAIPQVNIGSKILFHANEYFGSGGEVIVMSDGTTEGTFQMVKTDEKFVQNIIGFNNYGFVAAGTSNGFNPQLFSINAKTGTVDNLYNFEESSFNVQSVILLGVQNNQLYFASNLDGAIGREIYSLALDLPDLLTSTKEVSKDYSIAFTSDRFEVKSKRSIPVQVQIFDLLGRNISTIQTSSNTSTKKIPSKELLIYVFDIEGKKISHKVFRG